MNPGCTQTALTTATADGTGAFSAVSVQVPVTATVGLHGIGGRGLSSGNFTWAPFTVTP
jgi:hypothetical protein